MKKQVCAQGCDVPGQPHSEESRRRIEIAMIDAGDAVLLERQRDAPTVTKQVWNKKPKKDEKTDDKMETAKRTLAAINQTLIDPPQIDLSLDNIQKWRVPRLMHESVCYHSISGNIKNSKHAMCLPPPSP